MRKYFFYPLIFFLVAIFFSYRLLEVPRGITIDEAAFGYNAVLLSETMHDENNRFLPVFVLSINGRDWRQPVTQYFMAGFFKLLGASVYNLKFTSVIVCAVSAVLIFILGKELLGRWGALFSLLFFVTTPIVMIHSHLGLDNIMPIPFIVLWLINLLLFEKRGKKKYLIFSAVSLGIGFYSYKGMRSFATVWSLITAAYLSLSIFDKKVKTELRSAINNLLLFCVTASPFYLITPLLEYKYAGAIFGQVGKVESIYEFLLSYFASFDPSFLFITGDEMTHHSTGVHGMLLLASLPFFLMGLFNALKKGKFWKFLVIAFFAGPVLFGFPGSYHRASRLMAMIPIYAVICGLGATYFSKWRLVFVALLVLVGINYYDFVSYYWYQYPKDTYHIFYDTKSTEVYKILKEQSEERRLTAYTDFTFQGDGKVIDDFLRSIYFVEPLSVWQKDLSKFPENGILLSRSADLAGLQKLELDSNSLFLYVR